MSTRPRIPVWRRWVDGWIAFFTIAPIVWVSFILLPQLLRWLFAGLTSPWDEIGHTVVILLYIGVLFPVWISSILGESYPRMLENLWGPAENTGPKVDCDEEAA